MSKLLKFLVDVGVVEKVDAPTPTTPQAAASPPTVPPPATPATWPPPTQVINPEHSARIAELDKISRSQLEHIMANDGAPLVEKLNDTLDALADVVPDERARYLAALKLLGKDGFGVSHLLADYDKCLGALEEGLRVFEAESKDAIQLKVGSKVQAVEAIAKQIEAISAQISSLQQQIADLVVRKDSEQAGISAEQQKIDLARSRFTQLYSQVREGIETQRRKIGEYGASA